MRSHLPALTDPNFVSRLEDELEKRIRRSDRIGAIRPTNVRLGEYFFDTTLGLPIWAESADAGVITWVDATGTVV